MNVFRQVTLLFFWAVVVKAQSGGFISGVVRDRSGVTLPGAEVRVQSQESGARQKLYCDASGAYSSSELPAGAYRVTALSDGFRSMSQADIQVTAGIITRLDFSVQLLTFRQEMSVSAVESDIDPAASGLTVSRNSPAATLPENGREVNALFAIMPGATVTPASISGGGQFTVSGQRPNANSFWVDGVTGNIGMGIPSVPGSSLAETLPGMTTIGGMQSLASKEETERVELKSADFSAEFGDRPGAQVSIETRAGTNEFHGSVFGYMRPRAIDSLDWFAHGAGIDLPSAYLDGWGGGAGGPLWRNRTFFFASFERTDVRDSALQVTPVPSLAARAQAGLAYQDLFAAFPQPLGRALNADETLGYSPLQKDARVTNQSIRLDQAFGNRAQLFARYSDVPSSASTIELGAAYSTFHWLSGTLGLNLALGSFTQEFRFNYAALAGDSRRTSADTPALDLISGALTPFDVYSSLLRVSIEGVGQAIEGVAGDNSERQFTGAYGVSSHKGRHDLKAGFTYAKLMVDETGDYGTSFPLSVVSPSISALLAGIPLGLTYSNGSFAVSTTQRSSVYAQATLRVTDRLHLLLGLRWDVTPSSAGEEPAYGPVSGYAIGYWRGVGTQPVSLSNFAGVLSPTFSYWPTRYGQVSPRIGLAYHLKFPDIILRAGGGLFYDTGLGAIIANTNPLNVWQFLPSANMPPLPAAPAFQPVSSTLYLPKVWEWRTSLEKSLRESSLLSVSYFGSAGRKLLRDEAAIDPPSGALDALEFTSQGRSQYNALEAQFRGNINPRLYTLVSYTWGHSIDTGSSDTSPLLADGPANKGSSSFDVRQVLTASLSYRMPTHWGQILGGWTLSSTALARSGFPFNVTTVDESVGLGFENADRVNLVPGQPIWIANSGAPGGRELNPAAFQAPAAGANGDLGRNVLTGPGLFQLDASLRRQFHLYRNSSVEAVVSAFNLPNHPSFSNPVSYLGSALFGQANSTTNLMLGSGSPTTGLTPLFQGGGPRTVELSLRFSF